MCADMQNQVQPIASSASKDAKHPGRARYAQQSARTFTSDAGPALDRSPRGLRIVIAEDNRDAADTLRMLLEMAGHQVRLAETGTAAVDLVRRYGPDLLICDIGLPGMSGYEVAEALRSEAPFSSLLMFAWTGYSDAQQCCASAAAGFDRHFSKAGEPLGLLNEIERLAARFAKNVGS